ncbi:MAG: hypothetical protein FLDDKLPJ_00693 [Phycisphaerae bacterium]|nr:hypothetical protein [Phycisphaerae bacterium]
MSFVDLKEALLDWPYDSDKISVRKIRGADGLIKIQQRVELGIVQMFAEGRPDGGRPFGHDTLLDYHRARLAEYEDRNGTVVGFGLSAEESRQLREEASQYYRRYVAYFVLEDYDRVIEDTQHNLNLLDFVRDHALDPEDARRLEVFRPYVVMMNARAQAHLALREGHANSALAHVNRGLITIREIYDERGEPEAYERSEEVRILCNMRAKLASDLPAQPRSNLREKLRRAIEDERFEEAARLRDEIDGMPDQD